MFDAAGATFYFLFFECLFWKQSQNGPTSTVRAMQLRQILNPWKTIMKSNNQLTGDGGGQSWNRSVQSLKMWNPVSRPRAPLQNAFVRLHACELSTLHKPSILTLHFTCSVRVLFPLQCNEISSVQSSISNKRNWTQIFFGKQGSNSDNEKQDTVPSERYVRT